MARLLLPPSSSAERAGLLFVGWREDQGYLHVLLSSARSCAKAAPSVYVVGHPELVSAYTSSFQRYDMSDGLDIALIGPVPPGTYQLTASEHGAPCQAQPWGPGGLSYAPTVDVKANAISFVEMSLTLPQ